MPTTTADDFLQSNRALTERVDPLQNAFDTLPYFNTSHVKHKIPRSSYRLQKRAPLLHNHNLSCHSPLLQSPFLPRSTVASSIQDLLPSPASKKPYKLKPRKQLQRSFYHSRGLWLALYFCFNLGLTLYNKGVLGHFPFPYTLTAMHSLCGILGGHFVIKSGLFVPSSMDLSRYLVLLPFSVLYAVNIAISNASLGLVSIPMHQVIRSCTPIFVILFSSYLFDVQSSRDKLFSLVPVIIGVSLATCGDFHSSKWGFFLTLLGTVLAALKTIFTNVLQSGVPSSALRPNRSNSQEGGRFPFTLRAYSKRLPFLASGLRLHPLDLLIRMSPLAFVQCLVYAYLSGELEGVKNYAVSQLSALQMLALVLNGVFAFGLNIVSFTANKKAGALSMAVAANVKQVLTIVLAMMIFNLSITWTNTMGILLTLIGGAWYASVEYRETVARSSL